MSTGGRVGTPTVAPPMTQLLGSSGGAHRVKTRRSLRTAGREEMGASSAPSRVVEQPVPADLHKVRRIGWIVLGVQFIGFAIWSNVLVSRFALTEDFAVYSQAMSEIARGDLNPFLTMHNNYFWQDHAAFIMWPVALVWKIWPHAQLLLWLQDLQVVLIELVVFTWICDFIEDHSKRTRLRIPPPALALLGLLLFVLNPWILWAVSFDFHIEPLAVLLAVLAAYDFYHHRSRAWVWVVLVILCGDIGATYVVGLGLSLLLADRRRWRSGALLLSLGVASALVISAVHGDLGSNLAGYEAILPRVHGHVQRKVELTTLIVAMASRPWRLVALLWDRSISFFATLSPSGVIGIATPWTVGIPLIVLVENGLKNSRSNSFLDTNATFQSLAVFAFVTLGTVMIVTYLSGGHRRWSRPLAITVACLTLVNAIGWAVVWFPQTSAKWIRTSAPAAAVLDRVNGQIPSGDEVIVSQGMEGIFAERRWEYPITFVKGQSFPVRTRTIWFVMSPRQGVELYPADVAQAALGRIAALPGNSLVTSSSDVWVFRWDPPPTMTRFPLYAGSAAPIPGWTVPGAAGVPVTTGLLSRWHTAANGQRGYMVSGDYWPRPAGTYRASVRLSSEGPLDVEVWDTNTGQLLARQALTPTDGWETVNETVTLSQTSTRRAFSGSLLWRGVAQQPTGALSGDELEIRVWTPGNAPAVVYQLGLQRVG